MRKIKKLLSFITATFVAMSLALSSGFASAFDERQILSELDKLSIRYSDGTSELLNKHGGWLDLLGAVLRYAEATEADVKMHGSLDGNAYWADYISSPNGFKADPRRTPEAERNNLNQMLNNFNHNNRYWQSGYRIKDDYKLFLDWGAIYFTVENANHQSKKYLTHLYDGSIFLNKIREIYNLNPSTHKNQRDLLCIRAILRAMVEYDRRVGIDTGNNLDLFVMGMLESECAHELIYIISSDKNSYTRLKIGEDFSLGDRSPRRNAVHDYKVFSKWLINTYYDAVNKTEGKDYEIVYDANGYVAKINPVAASQTTSKNANKSATPASKDYVIKKTGAGVEQFVPTAVVLTAGFSGIVGLAYVVSRKRREYVD